jgi:hypothetical protein
MPRTVHTVQRPKGPAGTIAALDLDLVFTAADVANGNQFQATGRDVLLAWNTDASGHTLTLTSVADALGRLGHVTAYAIAAGKIAAFKWDSLPGWAQPDGSIQINSDNALVKFAILSLP